MGGEGDPQSASIYCCPPKAQMRGVTFHYYLHILGIDPIKFSYRNHHEGTKLQRGSKSLSTLKFIPLDRTLYWSVN